MVFKPFQNKDILDLFMALLQKPFKNKDFVKFSVIWKLLGHHPNPRPKSFQINEKSAKLLFLNGLSSKTMQKSEKSLFLNGLGTKSYEKVWEVFIF